VNGNSTSPNMVVAIGNHIRSSTTAANLTTSPPFRSGSTGTRWDRRGNVHFDGTNVTLLESETIAGVFDDLTDPTKQMRLDLAGLAASQVAVQRPRRPVCMRLDAVTAADDNFEFFAVADQTRVTAVGCRCVGTCTPTLATFVLENRAGTAMTGTPTCGTTGTMTFTAVTRNAASLLAAGDGLAFDVTNTPTAGDTYILCATIVGE
jgi:hypothetical protein